MEYKMVVLDLDGTLLDDAKEISPVNLQTLEELVERGVEVVIATGRRYRGAKSLIQALTFPVQVLANNGTVIRHSVTDEKLFCAYMEAEHFRQVVKLGRELEMYPLVHVDHYEEDWDFLVERDYLDPIYGAYLMPGETKYRVLEDLLQYENPRVTVLCFMGDEEGLEELQALIQQRYPGQYNMHLITSVPRVGYFLEVMARESSKWRSIERYAHSRGIQAQEIVAIGDDANDLQMVQEAGLGVAMANGIMAVKAVAKRVTEQTNDQDGVGLVLREIFQL